MDTVSFGHSNLKPSPVHRTLLQTASLSQRQTACTQTSEELPWLMTITVIIYIKGYFKDSELLLKFLHVADRDRLKNTYNEKLYFLH